MTEQYTVKIEEFELKLNDAETKIKGDLLFLMNISKEKIPYSRNKLIDTCDLK